MKVSNKQSSPTHTFLCDLGTYLQSKLLTKHHVQVVRLSFRIQIILCKLHKSYVLINLNTSSQKGVNLAYVYTFERPMILVLTIYKLLFITWNNVTKDKIKIIILNALIQVVHDVLLNMGSQRNTNNRFLCILKVLNYFSIYYFL